jgi:hypothetical protein
MWISAEVCVALAPCPFSLYLIVRGFDVAQAIEIGSRSLVSDRVATAFNFSINYASREMARPRDRPGRLLA